MVTYSLEGKVATITMDDGNKNLISPKMIAAINKAFDQAEKDKAVVIFTGRDGVFSAGFDLKILKNGVIETYNMLIGGFQLAARILSFPLPVIIANNGHSIAMSAFLLLSADYRIGTIGDFKIVTNEVAIGLTIPYAGLEISKQRLNPAHFVRASLLSEVYHPHAAIEAGFLDKVVTADQLLIEAKQLALQYAKLDLKAHKETKMRLREETISAVKNAIHKDKIHFLKIGMKRLIKR